MKHNGADSTCRQTSPTVSIVMGVYNSEATIELTIASMLRQSFRDFEFLIVDDGSVDNTAAKIEAFASVDNRLRVVRQSNQGLTKALICGCGLARGTYIARQDAEDWSLPDRLQQQVDLFQRDSTLGFVSCSTLFVGPAGEFLEQPPRSQIVKEATRQLLEERLGPPAHGSVMFRRDVYEQVGGYRWPFYFGQDSDLWMRLAEVSSIGYTADAGYVCVLGLEGISNRNREVQRQFGVLGQQCRAARLRGESEQPILAEAEALTARVLSKSVVPGATPNRAAAYYHLGSQLLRNRDRAARHYLRRAVLAQPNHWKAWVKWGQSMMRPAAKARRFTCEPSACEPSTCES